MLPVYCLMAVACAGEPKSESSDDWFRSPVAELRDAEVFPALSGRDEGRAEMAALKLVEQRQGTIRRLLKILEGKDRSRRDEPVSDEVVAEVIELLGVYRDPRAVDPLISRLTFRPDGYIPEETEDENLPVLYYPAAAALIKIGQPAVRPLLDVVRRDAADALERNLAAAALLEIENQDYAAGRHAVYDLARAKEVVSARLELLAQDPTSREQDLVAAGEFVRSYREIAVRPEEAKGFFSSDDPMFAPLKRIYAGKIDVHARGEKAGESAEFVRRLLEDWDPTGRPAEKVRTLLGRPTSETAKFLEYQFGDGPGAAVWKFSLRDDRVIRVKGPAG